MKKQNQGISLISLIITIIVIIILAAIVIFSGMGTPEKAQLSAVISDIDNVQTAVDQAYYGFYTEKAVAGEVWTKSQFYEAVATGETNRDNLTGTGIVPISKDGMVKMTLPNYEGRSWGVAVEDIDDHTQVGSVVLYPGFESNGKIYSTLLDVQNDGRDTQLAGGIQSSMTVTNVKTTTDVAGTVDAGTNVTDGTTLYISFDASENGTPVTVTPSLPYAITTNGDYEFTLTNASGKTKKHKISVTNYKVATVSNTLEIGDYVVYEGDANNSYIIDSNLTGYDSENGKELKPVSTTWRVWDKKADGTIVIIPTGKINTFYLEGEKGFVNSVNVIENACKIYANKEYGVTADKVRSLKIEDLEDERVSSNMKTVRDNYQKDSTSSPQYGETNAEQYGNSGYTSGNFYTEADGVTIRSTPNVASSTNPIVLKQTYYYNDNPEWNNCGNSKFPLDTYGTLLGTYWRWVASTAVNLGQVTAAFDICRATKTNIKGMALCDSNDYVSTNSYSICPLVYLDSIIKIDTNDTARDGSSPAKAWKMIRK